MKELYPEVFTLKDYLEKFKTEEHVERFKKSLGLYLKNHVEWKNELVVQKFEYLIDGKKFPSDEDFTSEQLENYHLIGLARDYFSYIYDDVYREGELFGKYLERKPDEEYLAYFKGQAEYFGKLCTEEENRRYWQRREISEGYSGDDIAITDKCYVSRYGIEPDLSADTIYGDWGCGCYVKEDNRLMGKFTADSGNVSVFRVRGNTKLEELAKDGNAVIIRGFVGIVSIRYDIEEYEYDGKKQQGLYCYVEGKGNLNFVTRQIGF